MTIQQFRTVNARNEILIKQEIRLTRFDKTILIIYCIMRIVFIQFLYYFASIAIDWTETRKAPIILEILTMTTLDHMTTITSQTWAFFTCEIIRKISNYYKRSNSIFSSRANNLFSFSTINQVSNRIINKLFGTFNTP